MADFKIYRFADAKTATIDVDATSFGTRSPRRVQRDAVLMYQANRRAGTHDTLTRAEVNDSKIKPWKQKHTGRARAGFKGSPLWKGGGIIHGPHPRDYGYTKPRKELRAATRAALAGKFKDGEVVFVDGLSFEKPQTKRIASMIAAFGTRGPHLLVVADHDENTLKSSRNVRDLTVVHAADLNAYDVLRHRTLIFAPAALDLVRERVGRADEHGKAQSKKRAAREETTHA